MLRDLPPHSTAAGVPAKVLGVATERRPSEVVDQNLRHVLFHKNGNGSSGLISNKDGDLSRKVVIGAANSFRAPKVRSKL